MVDRLHLIPTVGKENVCTPMVLGDLPPSLIGMIKANDVHKIEWMYSGMYAVKASVKYAMNFITPENIIKASHDVKCPAKLVDTINCADYELPLKMWLESMAHPSRVIAFSGKFLWMSDEIVSNSTIRMVSYIVEHDKVITITTASRGVSIIL